MQEEEGAVREEIWARPLFEEETDHGERGREGEDDIKGYGADRKDNDTGRGPDREIMTQ